MVTFSWWAALIAGFVGTLVMTAMMAMSSKTPLNNAPKMTLVQGSMVTDDPTKANAIGAFTHVIVMGSVVFGLGYVLLFNLFGSTAWWLGASIGAVHGIISGLMLPMMGRNHAKMQPASTFTGDATVERSGGKLRIMRPGPFGNNWGKATPIGFVIGHAVFGLVVVLTYSAII